MFIPPHASVRPEDYDLHPRTAISDVGQTALSCDGHRLPRRMHFAKQRWRADIAHIDAQQAAVAVGDVNTIA